MASSVKSDDLGSRVLDGNDVDLKEIEGHESEEGEQDYDFVKDVFIVHRGVR